MSDLEARIAEVIAANDKAHAFRAADYSDRERPTFRCACGVATIGMHHEHHREALAGALLTMTREAQAEALRGAADDMRRNWPLHPLKPSHSKHVEDWLRARADNLEAS